MAYVILSTGSRDLTRQELHHNAIVGRAADCDFNVHDILLSRKHCRFETDGKHWTIIDLASKNGTNIYDQKVDQHTLEDGDEIFVGKTKIVFHSGTLIPSPRRFDRPKAPIAIDPNEALAGTMLGVDFKDEPTKFASALPRPQPHPRDSDSFASEDIYSMLEGIASSSWDSIYETNARPIRTARSLPRPMVMDTNSAVMFPAIRPRRAPFQPRASGDRASAGDINRRTACRNKINSKISAAFKIREKNAMASFASQPVAFAICIYPSCLEKLFNAHRDERAVVGDRTVHREITNRP